MLFNSLPFAAFFIVTLLGYRILPARVRRGWLLSASLVFYATWYPEYLTLLLADLAMNYGFLCAMARTRYRRLSLAASVTVSLGILAYYKYAAFLLSAITPLSGLLEVSPGDLDIILPLGISFYTFQIIALSVDTYRRDIEPPTTFREYALFISFFPQLIAGPILRGREFLPQLRAGGQVDARLRHKGVWLIVCGLVKKVVFGDFLLAPFSNEVFANIGVSSPATHLIAAYSFAFQIYFDFSGYSDIARGLAALLGFDLPLNFREPYLSRNPSEFWRRWHQTLSRWLRDYLYIPLGGNRGSRWATYRNLMITMLLGGLWHGAGWQFVVWGGLHGLILGIHRAVRPTAGIEDETWKWSDLIAIGAMFHATCFAWIFFRAASFDDALAFVRVIASGDYGHGWPALATLIVGVCMLSHGLERWARLRLLGGLEKLLQRPGGYFAEGLTIGALVALVVLCSGTGAEFIYFQF